MQKFSRVLISAVVAWTGVSLPAAKAEVVYDNRTNSLNQVFYFGEKTVGDEIVLGGGSRQLSYFSFQYSTSTSFTGSEGIIATVKLFQNDGSLFNGYNAPGTCLFSNSFSIDSRYAATKGGTMEFSPTLGDFNIGDITLPASTLTWSVQFSGNGGNFIGLDLFNNPAVGQTTPDYWQQDSPGSWELMQNTNGVPMDFGAYVEAVPEPSSLGLVLGGGAALAALNLVRRKK